MKRSNRPVVVTAPEWRALQKKGQIAGLSRSLAIERAADGAVSFTASSADDDRYGDTIVQAGGNLANFKANPVLLWAHSHHTPPVGKAPGVGLNAQGNLSTGPCVFTSDEEHPFGAQVGRMVKGGFLNAVSIGFLPIAWEERYDEGGRFKGYNFTKWELLEISVVPVPANPHALIESKGFANELANWCQTPDDTSPMARGFQSQVLGFLKAADDMQTRATDEADAGDFSEMIRLLQRIEANTKAPRFTVRLGEFEVSGPDIASVKALMQAVTKDTKDLPAVVKTCEACGSEDGCNIDCATCLAHAKADETKPPEEEPVAKAAPVTDAGGDPFMAWLTS